MKKYFSLFLSLFTVILVSCNQNNPSDPSNPTDPDNPSHPSGVKKVRYIVESASWFTYQDESNGTHWSTPLNVVSKTIEERGSEAKFLKSRSTYEADELKSKYTVQNESDRDYMWIVYPSISDVKDTIIWYDDARTKYKEYRNGNVRYIYEYDSKGRQITYRSYLNYSTNYMNAESKYTYSGHTEYGETKFYNEKGELINVQNSTSEFTDETFSHRKSYVIEAIDYSSNYRSTTRIDYEWNGDVVTKQVVYAETEDQEGNVVSSTRTITTYSWSDDLNNTSKSDYYVNGNLYYSQAGYNRYTY